MKLIALAGKAGSGKDTVADRLCAVHGFVRYEFARPIKAMTAAIGLRCDTREEKELPHPLFGVSPRRMWQTLGKEWGRDLICDDIWLRCASEHIRRIQRWMDANDHKDLPVKPKGLVITDCRFANEAAFIAARDGVIWHVQRPGVQDVEAHSSESGLGVLPGDAVILNNGTIETLHYHVDSCIECPALFTRTY